jgi:ubiquinone/menaquinone biosynthesis C-methylase UbiE
MTADTKHLSQQRYGRYANRYVTSRTHATGDDLAYLIEIVRPQPQWRVLDIATGGGHTALTFAPHVTRVIATDLTWPMLKAARAHIARQNVHKISLGTADAESLPFAAQTFDLVTCRIAPHHFADCARFLSECARVAKRSNVENAPSSVIVQDHLLPEEPGAACYIDAFERMRDPSHNRAFSKSEWLTLFRTAGLVVDHTQDLIKKHRFREWTQRQECSSHTVRRLVNLIDRAPPIVNDWLQPQGFGTANAEFVNHHIIIAGHRPSSSEG